jgi:hypothetical protein
VVDIRGITSGGAGALLASTSGAHNAGAIEVTGTQSVRLTDTALLNSTGASGSAGAIVVTTPSLLVNNSRLQATTSSTGAGGAVTITARDLALNDSVISSSSIGPGNAGSIAILSDGAVRLANGAIIESSTEASNGGRAGSVTIGSLTQRVPLVEVTNGAGVVTSSANTNAAGDISIYATDVLVDGAGSRIASENTSSAGGAAGSILIDIDPITISNGGETTHSMALPATSRFGCLARECYSCSAKPRPA